MCVLGLLSLSLFLHFDIWANCSYCMALFTFYSVSYENSNYSFSSFVPLFDHAYLYIELFRCSIILSILEQQWNNKTHILKIIHYIPQLFIFCYTNCSWQIELILYSLYVNQQSTYFSRIIESVENRLISGNVFLDIVSFWFLKVLFQNQL